MIVTNQRPDVPPAGTAFQGARAALVLLLLINLFNYIDRQVLAAVVDLIRNDLFSGDAAAQSATLTALQNWCREHLGFKPELALMGVLSMAFMVAYMVFAPLFGKLAEKHSRWMLTGIAVLVWSLASGASGLAGTFMVLLVTRCFVGIGEAAYGPVAPALLADYYPAAQRGRILSFFYIAIPVGSALGYVVGGAVARSPISQWGSTHLGIEAASWRWAFYLLVIPGLILGVWSLFKKDPPRGQADNLQELRRPVTRADYAILLRTRSYVLCSLGMAAMTFAIGGIAFWMPFFLKKTGAEGPVEVIFGGIVCLAGIIGTLLGGMLGDKLRSRFPGSYFLVSGVAMLLGFPFMLATIYAPFPILWVLVFITCFCLFFNTGPTNTILANVTHPSMRPAAFALNIFFIHAFGDVISPVIIGIISDRAGMQLAFCLVSAMFVVAAVFWLMGTRYLKEDTERSASLLRT